MYHLWELWEPARLGPLTLKNRGVRSATNEHFSTPEGDLTALWADTQIELARHEVGLVISGHMTVDRGQRADEGQPALDAQTDPALLRRAAEGIHQFGGRFLVQLSHTGLKAPEALNHQPPRGPADFTLEELDHLVDQFVFAARLCQQAGADGVQIHNAHGYLLSNFLNPAQNSRTDAYGGSLENRFRLPGRILSGVRQACGKDFALLVKADANGCGDLPGLLRLYQQAGVDGIEVSGVDFNTRAGEKSPFYLSQLLAARDGISVPLILVGGIFSLHSAQAVLEAGIPFVAFSRALICQPDFVSRMKNGLQTESSCLACNGCYSIYRRPVRCVQHTQPIQHLACIFHLDET